MVEVEHRVDDLQAVAAKRRAGLGEVDERVHHLGHLGLGRAVAEVHLDRDAEILEVRLGDARELGGDAAAGRDVPRTVTDDSCGTASTMLTKPVPVLA